LTRPKLSDPDQMVRAIGDQFTQLNPESTTLSQGIVTLGLVPATERKQEAPFALLLALGLASLEPEDLAHSKLSLELGVSAWLRRATTDLVEAQHTALLLRGALLSVSGLDEATEPVPLIARDRTLAVRSLCLYLHGLIIRAASSSGLTRVEIAEAALLALEADGAFERRLTS
jgi:hypothetical protein